MDVRKESRQARIERTLAGTGPLWQVGRLLAKVKDGRTLAQRLAAGEEIERDLLGLPHALHEQFRLSLQSIRIWGCPFCGTAHGSGFGASRSVKVEGLEGNEFYYNPLTQQLFTISATCLRKQTGLAERFTDIPVQENVQTVQSSLVIQQPPSAENSRTSDARPVQNTRKRRQKEPDWVRKPVAFLFAFYCGLVAYSHLLVRDKRSNAAR